VTGRIYLLNGEAKLIPMEEAAYDSEKLLQELLAKYPDLLAGEQINSVEPRRWLLVTREMSVPDEEDGVGRWSLDHLFLDQDAVPTLVEVKRSTDTRIRREVVGQMLDYAANAVAYWPVEQVQAKFESRCEAEGEDSEEILTGFLGDDAKTDEFWLNVKTNLQAGRIRLVFVADVIPPELRRVVEFLNEQMDPAEVLAIEVKQFIGEGMKTLVPRVLGQTETARQKKSSAKASTYHSIDEAEYLRQVDEEQTQPEAKVVRRLMEWARKSGLPNTFNQGVRGSAFIPVLEHNAKRIFPVSVQGKGLVVIQMRWLREHEPFSEIAKREELLKRLQELSELRITAAGIEGFPKVPVSVLCDDAQFQKLVAILDWIVHEIRAV
jgi:hypothetical protein